MEQLNYQTVVIGGGAAGLTAATVWGRRCGKGQVLLLEKQSKIGRKLLATGNGRCNISHQAVSPEHYHGDRHLIKSVLSRWSVDDLTAFFQRLGVWLRSDDEGRLYPYTNQAVTIRDALWRECERQGVQERLSCSIVGIRRTGGQFVVATDDRTIRCGTLVIACGSKAAPSLGADDSGYQLLKQLGIGHTQLFPSLCPVTTAEKYRSLKGVRAKGKAVLLRDGKPLQETAGEIQFTDHGLSGICIFELSRAVNEYFACGTMAGQSCQTVQIALDLLPDHSFQEVYAFLENSRRLFTKETADRLLSGILPQPLAEVLAQRCRSKNKTCASLTARDLKQLVSEAKHLLFTPEKAGDFAAAQVCAGGVDSRFVDPATLMSRSIKNLFLCGEVLDVDGDCGGYNLHFAIGSAFLTACLSDNRT